MNRESDPQAGEHSTDVDRLAPLLRRLLAELDGIERRAVVGNASRRLIQHGRSLDSLLWQAHRQWKDYNRGADAGTLDALCRTLIAAQDDAEQLKVALEVTSAPLAASGHQSPPTPGPRPVEPEVQHDADRHVRNDLDEVGDRIRQLLESLERRLSPASGMTESAERRESSIGREASGPAAAEAGEASALEGMLWRITSDWQHLQRAPSPDRIALLCDKLERASDEVRRLAADIEDVSRRTVGEGIADSVAASVHPPFRDPVTGSLSREGFDTLVIGELKRSRRYRRPFTLLLVEKPGDDPREMAEVLERLTVALRGSDYVGRYVDRLIAVGLPETTSEAALVAARRVLRSLPVEASGGAAARFGLASLPQDGRTLAELAALARRQIRDGPASGADVGRDDWGV